MLVPTTKGGREENKLETGLSHRSIVCEVLTIWGEVLTIWTVLKFSCLVFLSIW